MATTFLEVKNRAESYLAEAMVAGDLTLTVTDGTVFPASYFHITIDNEILECSSRTGDVLTVTRAKQSTTASAHAIGEAVSLNVTAKHISDLNTAVNALEAPIGAKVRATAAQSINNSALQVLYFDDELWDTDGIHDNVTNSDRLTCMTAGIYIVTASVGFDTDGTGRRMIEIYHQGRPGYLATQHTPAIAGVYTHLNASMICEMAVGDWVRVMVYQDSGGLLDVRSAPNCSEFAMHRIGAAP